MIVIIHNLRREKSNYTNSHNAFFIFRQFCIFIFVIIWSYWRFRLVFLNGRRINTKYSPWLSQYLNCGDSHVISIKVSTPDNQRRTDSSFEDVSLMSSFLSLLPFSSRPLEYMTKFFLPREMSMFLFNLIQ